MLPLLPILLIAKLSMAVSAGKGKMNQEQLDNFLDAILQHRDFKLPELLQNEVNFTTGLLVATHSALVLLEASVRKFNPNDNLLMEVSSYKPDWVEKDQNDIVIGGRIKESETRIERVGNVDPEFSLIPNICKKNYGNNLKACLSEAKDIPNDFNLKECIMGCLNSVEDKVSHKDYLEGALQLIYHVLLTADLKQVGKWLKGGQPDPLHETSDWLEKELGLVDIKQQLSAPALNLSNDVKMDLSRIKVMVEWNAEFYVETLQRLNFGSADRDDIKEAVAAITTGLTDEQKKPWTDMLKALYGAIGWHIFRQAQLAVQRTNILLENGQA